MVEKTKRILLFGFDAATAKHLVDVLRHAQFPLYTERTENVDVFRVALASEAWDAIVCTYAASDEALADATWTVPCLVVYEPPDESAALALPLARFNDVIPAAQIGRLPFVLRRELALHALQTRSTEMATTAQFEESMRRSEVRFHSVIEGIGDIVLLADNFQVIRYCNQALHVILGHDAAEVLGAPLEMLWHPDQRDTIRNRLAEVLAGGAPLNALDHKVRRADGAWEVVETTARRMNDVSGQPMLLLHLWSITRRHQAEAGLLKLNRTLAVLSAVNQTIVRTRDVQALFNKICRIAVEQGGFRVAMIAQLDATTHQLNKVARAGEQTGLLDAIERHLNELPMERPSDGAPSNEDVLVINDSARDDRLTPWRAEALRFGYPSLGVFPLRVEGVVRARLYLCASESGFFDTAEVELLEQMAEDISFTMEFVEQDERRKEAEAGLLRYAQRMEALHSIDLGIIKAESPSVLADVALSHLRRLVQCQFASLITVDPQTREATVVAADSDGTFPINKGPATPMPADWASYFDKNHVRRTDRVLLRKLPAVWPQSPTLDANAAVSTLSILLTTQSGPIGFLGLISATPDYFAQEHEEMATQIGDQLAIALRQMGLMEELSHYALELENKVETRTADLTASKERAEAILNSSIDGILLATPDLHIQQTNAAFNLLFASAPDEFIGQSMLAFMQPQDAIAFDQMVHSGKSSLHGTMLEIGARRRNGTTFDAEISVGRLKDQGFVCAIRDITERKRVQEALRTSEEKFRLLLDAAPVAIFITDRTGNLTLVNRQAEQLVGYTREELIGKSVDMLVPAQQRGRHIHHREDYLHAPRVRPMGAGLPLFAQRKDGTTFAVEVELSYIHTQSEMLVLSFMVDISERRRAEDALRRSETRYRLLADHITDLVTQIDIDGTYLYVSPSSKALVGYEPDEMAGHASAGFIHPDEVPMMMKLESIRDEFPESITVNQRFLHKEGHEIWLETFIRPIRSEVTGKVMSFIASSRDITERRKAEEALHLALTKERELSELKTRFVSMASHEFRTPLASILAMTETLSAYRARLTSEQIDERLSKIRGQVDHLKDIMDDVLQLARMQARRVEFNPMQMNLDALCRDIVDEFRSRPSVVHRLEYTCAGDLPDLQLDRKLMRQIVSNLLSNAIKYSPANQPVHLELRRDDDQVVITFRDEGIGIPKEDQRRLFEPFHRARNVGTISGTGLGLVITKESVELHGGTISIVSDVNMGTSVIVSLPIVGDRGNANVENTAH